MGPECGGAFPPWPLYYPLGRDKPFLPVLPPAGHALPKVTLTFLSIKWGSEPHPKSEGLRVTWSFPDQWTPLAAAWVGGSRLESRQITILGLNPSAAAFLLWTSRAES